MTCLMSCWLGENFTLAIVTLLQYENGKIGQDQNLCQKACQGDQKMMLWLVMYHVSIGIKYIYQNKYVYVIVAFIFHVRLDIWNHNTVAKEICLLWMSQHKMVSLCDSSYQVQVHGKPI